MNCPSLSSSGRTSVVSRMAAESTHPRSAISSVTPPTFDFFYSSPRAVNFLCLCYAFIPVGRFPLYMIHFCKMPPPGERENSTAAHVAVCARADEQTCNDQSLQG